jgi:hypothetical protein
LCDFTSTNNSDFICTPIAPPAPCLRVIDVGNTQPVGNPKRKVWWV